MILVDWLGQVQGDPGVRGDDLRDLLNAERNRSVVVALAERRDHRTADVAYLRVVEDALQPIANLNSVFPRVQHDEHQNAAVGALGTYLPLVFERSGKFFNRLVVVERLDGHDGDLGMGPAVDLGAEVLKAELG